MARDPPSLLASSELRDIPLEPSVILDARITIIHPQLRDLIVPLERGRVLYPRGSTIEEIQWTQLTEDDEGESIGKSGGINASVNPFVKLNFTPNCLTGSRGMLAAGGQHGELHLSHIPPRTLNRRGGEGDNEPKPFRLDVKLDTQAINNAINLLPDWPAGWAEVGERRRIGYVGRERGRGYGDEDEDMDVEAINRDGEDAGDEIDDDDDDDDEAMDLDEDDGTYEQPLSPATYPNTVPFRHAVRLPTTSAPTGSSRRAASFSSAYAHRAPTQAEDTRLARQSFSQVDSRSSIRIVSSNPDPSYSPHSSDIYGPSTSFTGSADTRTRMHAPARHGPEPRLLISSNDQSVRMLAIRESNLPSHPAPRRTTSSYERESELTRLGNSEPTIRSHYRPNPHQRMSPTSALANADWRTLHPVLPPPPAIIGSRFGWDSSGVNQSLIEAHRSEQIAAQRELRLRQIGDFEAAVGMGGASGGGTYNHGTQGGSLPTRIPSFSHPIFRQQAPWSQVRGTVGDTAGTARRAVSIGTKMLNFPVNHSSFSPDLKTMISVGDSTDVSIFEVIDGGREFRQIATYTAATDSGFSSAWSKDGRKFAVASQDGQVTVWDHRSSRPLATIFTSSAGSNPTSASYIEPQLEGWSQDRGLLLFNPVTGEPSSGASTSGREAARVVKFSPEGSSRDLMVFSEENTNIHIVDAKTFNSHVILPVPFDIRSSPSSTTASATRVGVEGGECGIAGISFDPTGDWLYSGTERTIVEWDMRRIGGGEGGGWNMA